MKTKAVRVYGVNDFRLEEFDLPEMQEDEILAKVVSDSICMSSYKVAIQGAAHKRIPNDVAENPIIIGHEFCGEIIAVGEKWKDRYHPGEKFAIQPALAMPENVHAAPGYSFQYIGGDATYIIIPNVVMERECLLPYKGEAFYTGSLAEPVSCIIGGYHVNYHTQAGTYVHSMGIVEGGKVALLAGVGPMGLGAIDYAIHCDRKPSLLVVTDIDEARLARAASIYTVEEAAKNGVKLVYVNTGKEEDPVKVLRDLTDGEGYDDVFVYAPVKSVVEQASAILGFDGCLNFFAGPSKTDFSAEFNFYNVHYNFTHVAGNSGGNTDDLIEALDMMSRGLINPSAMVTHIGGLDAAVETTLNLPQIPGGKKLIYTHISMPLTAIADFAELGKTDPMFAELARLCEANNGLWSAEAERYLLANAKSI
ncbi:MAG: zinc-binding dehydrogenase [Clostridia bacterium]|nr:zinc-binding dehydrogenase [Clostridia bacterium]